VGGWWITGLINESSDWEAWGMHGLSNDWGGKDNGWEGDKVSRGLYITLDTIGVGGEQHELKWF